MTQSTLTALITPTSFGSHWQTIRAACKVWWSDLTEADLDRVAGSFNRLMFLLQIKYGYSLIQAESEFQKRMSAHELPSPPSPSLS